jgi:NifU-like protein involved in Fe-S cluster formation
MINDNVCKYTRCRKPLTNKQIVLMNGEKICNDCLQARIKFQQQNIYEKKFN